MTVDIRLETTNDYLETENVVREAFWNQYSPGCYEHYLLHLIRHTPDFVHELNYVAVVNNKVVGNVICMKGEVCTNNKQVHPVLTLGPIAVDPAYQGKGIGAKLIAHALLQAKSMHYKAVLLCGDPAYYSANGFESAEKWDIRTADNKFADALQIAPLDTDYLNTNLKGKQGIYTESSHYGFDVELAEQFDQNFTTKEKIEGTPSQMRFLELVSQMRGPND